MQNGHYTKDLQTAGAPAKKKKKESKEVNSLTHAQSAGDL